MSVGGNGQEGTPNITVDVMGKDGAADRFAAPAIDHHRLHPPLLHTRIPNDVDYIN